MIIRKSFATPAAALLVALATVLLTACASGAKIRSESAPNATVTNYRTYGFFEKLGTDDSTYASVLSQNLKVATAREMEARGYRPAANPDLLVNFRLGQKEKVEGRSGPTFGFGIGGGSYRGAYGVGVSTDTDIESKTEGTLNIDVVDRASNAMVWSGSAEGTITPKVKNDPKAVIDTVVPKIFAKYPGRAAAAVAP